MSALLSCRLFIFVCFLERILAGTSSDLLDSAPQKDVVVVPPNVAESPAHAKGSLPNADGQLENSQHGASESNTRLENTTTIITTRFEQVSKLVDDGAKEQYFLTDESNLEDQYNRADGVEDGDVDDGGEDDGNDAVDDTDYKVDVSNDADEDEELEAEDDAADDAEYDIFSETDQSYNDNDNQAEGYELTNGMDDGHDAGHDGDGDVANGDDGDKDDGIVRDGADDYADVGDSADNNNNDVFEGSDNGDDGNVDGKSHFKEYHDTERRPMLAVRPARNDDSAMTSIYSWIAMFGFITLAVFLLAVRGRYFCALFHNRVRHHSYRREDERQLLV